MTGAGRKKAKHSSTSFSNRHKLEVARHFIQCEDVQATLAIFYPSLNDHAKEPNVAKPKKANPATLLGSTNSDLSVILSATSLQTTS
ncbi:hypothetical protein DVH05_026964 [Phytophthora capsici]|nr:hypothetical protein DVH05_026964 [Phytophthora capsici]